VEIIVYNSTFHENPQSILHVMPLLVVEMTCALQISPLFSELVDPTSNFDMGIV